MKQIENKIMLISYPDSLGGNLKNMEQILENELSGTVCGLHILPFYPSSGDRGFAVITYEKVDPAWGTWEDIDRLAERYFLCADFMLNHASVRSAEFLDYMEKGDASEYADMFLDWNQFWPNGEPTAEEMAKLYRRKPAGPVLNFTRKDGKTVRLWNTFFEEQIDIDPYAPSTQRYFARALGTIASHVTLIRFDAFAYASKRPGTSCFFVEPDVWNILELAMKPVRECGGQMLAEIHEHYSTQMKMAQRGYWVYDFALPMLTLHTVFSGNTDRIIRWMKMCPRNQFTTLDTHDGIGCVDVKGLLTDEEIGQVADRVGKSTENIRSYVKMPLTLHNGGKRLLYQLGGTFYSAMECNDDAYLLARAVQYFAPGIPMVYYVGMLAGKNDDDFVKAGGELRGLNRHNYSREEVREAVARPVVKKLLALSRFRNTYPAFAGEISVDNDGSDHMLRICRSLGYERTTLYADFSDLTFRITYTEDGVPRELSLDD